MSDTQAYQNTDRELWREEDDYYAPSIHVTENGGIGINVGGTVIVKTLRQWHALVEMERKDDEDGYCPACDARSIPVEDRGGWKK